MSENPPADSVTSGLADGVPGRGVNLAYGAKETIDGLEIIPVALVTYGFGASDQSATWGVGGGGGGVAIPIGAYVASKNGLRFRANTFVTLALATPLVAVVGRALVQLLRR